MNKPVVDNPSLATPDEKRWDDLPWHLHPELAMTRLWLTHDVARRWAPIGVAFAVFLVAGLVVEWGGTGAGWGKSVVLFIMPVMLVTVVPLLPSVATIAYVKAHGLMVCPKCLYDLRGTPSAEVCHECGLSLTRAPPIEYWTAALEYHRRQKSAASSSRANTKSIRGGSSAQAGGRRRATRRRRTEPVSSGVTLASLDPAQSFERVCDAQRVFGLFGKLLLLAGTLGFSVLAGAFVGFGDPAVLFCLTFSFGILIAMIVGAAIFRPRELAKDCLIASDFLICPFCVRNLDAQTLEGDCPTCGLGYAKEGLEQHWTNAVATLQVRDS